MRSLHGGWSHGTSLVVQGRFVSVRPPVGGSPFCCYGSLQYRSDRLRCAPHGGHRFRFAPIWGSLFWCDPVSGRLPSRSNKDRSFAVRSNIGASVLSRPNKGRSFEVRPDIGATVPRRPNKGRSRRPNKGRSFPVRPNIGATVDQVGGCPTCLTCMRLACRRFPGFCEPLGCSDTQN